MNEDQRGKLKALARCTMLPGSWDKRFVRDVAGKPDDWELSPKQAEMVDKLTHRYRRQIAKLHSLSGL